MPKWSSDSIQIQHLLKLNLLTMSMTTNIIDSNTTFVKVKYIIHKRNYWSTQNSNTTFVKVKFK